MVTSRVYGDADWLRAPDRRAVSASEKSTNSRNTPTIQGGLINGPVSKVLLSSIYDGTEKRFII